MPLRLTTAGESHGPRLTAILEGIPAGLRVDPHFVGGELARRQHGYGRGGRMKIEKDEALFEGGVRAGLTLGSPIAIGILNRDYASWADVMGPMTIDPDAAAAKRLTRPRPGHADLAGGMKFGASDLRDVLERASARESAARVAAGAVCKLLLRDCGISVRSGVLSLGAVADTRSPRCFAALEKVREDSPLRAVDASLEPEMIAAIDEAKSAGETLGGSLLVAARGVPPGLGSYTSWDEKLDGRIGRALFSVPAVKAVEFGSAIAASRGRPRGRRDERRGHRRRRVHEAHRDACARARFGRPRDGRSRALGLREKRRDRRAGLRRDRRGHARLRPRRRPARPDGGRPPRRRPLPTPSAPRARPALPGLARRRPDNVCPADRAMLVHDRGGAPGPRCHMA